jgi:endonuclease/exonuclease/phosphatase family metal-dependent hydrolase
MEKPLRLRVGTLNTWAKPRFDEIARWAADRRLDLLALQEVDRNWSERTNRADVAAEIARRLDWQYSYGPAISLDTPGEGRREYGNAILSRWPIDASVIHQLSDEIEWDRDDHSTEPRIALETTLRTPAGRLRFIGTHLANTRHLHANRITRIQGSRLARLVWEGRTEYPTLLAGDLNAPPERPEVGLLATFLREVDERRLPTWPTREIVYRDWSEPAGPTHKIDYIFASPELRIIDGGPDESYAHSDHLPIIATLEMEPGA